jgi:Xaa-Pro aminopeptidase
VAVAAGGGRPAALAAGLAEMGCQALLVIARSAAEPDLAAFLAAPVHLGPALLVAARGASPRLAYLTPMERDEAAAGGLPLLTPEELEVDRGLAAARQPADHLAWLISRALAACQVAPGRVALAGQTAAGELYAACSRLARDGWQWVAGNELVRSLRKDKRAGELLAIRGVAAAVGEAFRRVARLLAAATRRGDELWFGAERATVGRLRAEVAEVFAAHGLEQPKGNILAPGAAAGVPHSAGVSGRLRRARAEEGGDMI